MDMARSDKNPKRNKEENGIQQKNEYGQQVCNNLGARVPEPLEAKKASQLARMGEMESMAGCEALCETHHHLMPRPQHHIRSAETRRRKRIKQKPSEREKGNEVEHSPAGKSGLYRTLMTKVPKAVTGHVCYIS